MKKNCFLLLIFFIFLYFALGISNVRAAAPGWEGWNCDYCGCTGGGCDIKEGGELGYGITQFGMGLGAVNYTEICEIIDEYDFSECQIANPCGEDKDCFDPLKYIDVCRTSRCPNDSECNTISGACFEGETCHILDYGPAVPGPSEECNGKWDPDEDACVKCDPANPIQLNVYGTSNSIGNCCYNDKSVPPGPLCNIAGSNKCEQACGADPECDEATYDPNVPAPGGVGVCKNCVFVAAPPPPPPPPPPSDCEEDCTCTCPAECPCGSGTCPPELRGGLVPCGKNCDDPCTKSCECCPCTLCHLFVLFKKIVDFLTLNIIFPLAILMIVVGGVMFLTAGGDPGRISGAKKILTAVVIGLVIILAAWLIVDTVITFLTPANSPFQSWETIDCPVCGDGNCDSGETPENCPADCGAPPPPPPPVCTPTVPLCNGVCPAGCTVAQDPDCPPCQGGNSCCGIGCNNANDSDCPLPGCPPCIICP